VSRPLKTALVVTALIAILAAGLALAMRRDTRPESPETPSAASARTEEPPTIQVAVQLPAPPEDSPSDGDLNAAPQDADHLDRLRELARTAPAETLAWCLAHSGKDALARDVAEVLAVWSQTAPDAALAWLLEPGRPPALVPLQADVLFNWAETKPTDAASWLSAHPHHQSPENLRAFFGAWMLDDDRTAIAWALKHLEPIQREGILPTLLAQVRTPELLPDLLDGMDAEVTRAALRDAAQALAEENPDLAGVMTRLSAPDAPPPPGTDGAKPASDSTSVPVNADPGAPDDRSPPTLPTNAESRD